MDIKWEILQTLIRSKKGLRASQIADGVKKPQSHVEYHLKQMIVSGLIVSSKDNGMTLYSAQNLLVLPRATEDLQAVLLNGLPNLLAFMDLSQCEDITTAVLENIRYFLKKIEHDLDKSIKDSKNL